jgi:hypothetical protein
MPANPCFIGVIPYENDTKSLTMCVYVDSDGNGIQDIQNAANEMFADYSIEWIDLQQRSPCKIVTELPSSKKQKGNELSDLSRTIEKNLHVFDNLLNVTAVCASYKVTNFKQEDTPCVTVFVLEKGRVPAGEKDIREINELNGYSFDVVEGYYKPATGPSVETCAYFLRGGVGIGVRGGRGVGTLGGFLEDDKGMRYILSCEHVLNPREVKNNPNEKENPNNTGTLEGLSEDLFSTLSFDSHAEETNSNRSMDNKIIEHPAQSDYDEMLKTAETNLDLREKRKSNFEMKCRERSTMNDDRCKNIMEKFKQDIKEAEENHEKIKSQRPREIGRYVGGLKSSVYVSKDNKSYNVYVDAAIAKLNDDELELMKLDKLSEGETSYCPLYGFKTTNNFCPSGDLKTFSNEFHKLDSEVRFAKIGRTTGYTDKGFIDPAFKEIFVKITRGQLSSGSHPFFPYCKDCKQSFIPEKEEMHEKKDYKSSTKCAACREEIGKINVTPVKEDATTKNAHVEDVTTENDDVEDVTTENDDVEDITTKNDDVEDVTTENDDVEDVTTENDDVEDIVKDNVKYRPVWVVWVRNCFVIRKQQDYFFCREGDSGALVFDQKSNHAWGLVFGTFDVGSINSDFCLASPLCVTLKALEDEIGIKGLKLW